MLTVLDDAALEMRGASDVRLVLEIACTRLARPEADLTIEALAERVARLEPWSPTPRCRRAWLLLVLRLRLSRLHLWRHNNRR